MTRRLPVGPLSVCTAALLLAAGCREQHAPRITAVTTECDETEAGRAILFTASVDDADGNELSVRFAWGDGDTSGWSDWISSDSTVTAGHVWRDVDTCCVTAQAEDTRGRRSAWSDGVNVVIHPKSGTVKWAYTAAGDITSSPAIAVDGTIYVGSDDNKLHAVNPDGTEKWTLTAGGDVSSPAIGRYGTVYFGSDDGKLHEVSPEGEEIWSRDLGSAVGSPAIGADGTVYVTSGSSLCAFSSLGDKKWEFETGAGIGTFAVPVIGPDSTIYVGSNSGKLHAVKPDGIEKWAITTGGDIDCSPAIGPYGTIYFGSEDGRLREVSPEGEVIWSLDLGSAVYSPAIGTDGSVYVGCDDGRLCSLTPLGVKNWEYATNGSICSTPAIGSDGMLYIGSGDNKVYAIDANGMKRWEVLTSNDVTSSPAIGTDGTVYVGSEDNRLYAISAWSPLADAPWPKFRHDNRNTGRAGGR